MPYYFDTISDLKYSQGMVSFKMSAFDQSIDINAVYIPFADFKNIAIMLTREVKSIDSVHSNWLASQVDSIEKVQSDLNPSDEQEKLTLIASV